MPKLPDFLASLHLIPEDNMTKFVTNPFKTDIDLTDDNCVKQYQTVTKGLDSDRNFDLSIGNLRSFETAIKKAASLYAWGAVCTYIPE